MSACSLLERMPILNSATSDATSMDFYAPAPPTNGMVGPPMKRNAPAPILPPSQAPIYPGGPGHGNGPPGGGGGSPPGELDVTSSSALERDYYGCYCLKFIVKNGTHITEDKVLEDFGQFGEVVDVRGPGLFSGLRGNHVYVRFIDKVDAEEALGQLTHKYYQLTPASISDVLPDNYGLYTISFYNKTGIPSSEVRKEFSKFGEVKNLTGSLDVKGGRVFVSYKEKTSAVQALQAFFFRKDRYPNMKFALPRCEKDYFGCYCLKFYNKSGDVTEEKVMKDFGQFGEVVDVRGPGLFDVTGDDVYVRYKEKSSAEQALNELVGRYDSLCLAPPSDIQADKFGYFTITFVNDKCLSKSDVWYIFSKFGTVACVNGTFDCKKGRVFVSYKEKQGALNALETMLITKEYHLQVSKNSTVRKNDYNVVGSNPKEPAENGGDFSLAGLGSIPPPGSGDMMHPPPSMHPPPPTAAGVHHLTSALSHMSAGGSGPVTNPGAAPLPQDDRLAFAPPLPGQQLPPPHPHHNRSRESSLVPSMPPPPPGSSKSMQLPPPTAVQTGGGENGHLAPNSSSSSPTSSAKHVNGSMGGHHPAGYPQQHHHPHQQQQQHPHQQQMMHNNAHKNGGLVKFNRNVEKDIFGYFCLSFLNEDGDINEKKVRHDFGKFGEVVSVRGALGKQKGHVFVRFRRKEAAENCLNCLNSFPLSEMSELFGKYLFLSPATPRDIDCDMYGLFSISFLNLNMKTFREIRNEFAGFGEIVRLTSGGSGNTDELVSISYAEKTAAVKALQTHFTNKEFPYLDIAKGSSLLLVNSSDSSDNEDESEYMHHHHHHHQQRQQQLQQQQHRQPPAGLSPLTSHPPPPIGQHLSNSSSTAVTSTTIKSSDPFHDPVSVASGIGGSDVVDELLKPLQSYFSIYRTGQYHSIRGGSEEGPRLGQICSRGGGNGGNPAAEDGSVPPHQRSPDKKYRIKSMRQNGIHQQPPPQQQQQQPNGFIPAGAPPQRLPLGQQQQHFQQQHSLAGSSGKPMEHSNGMFPVPMDAATTLVPPPTQVPSAAAPTVTTAGNLQSQAPVNSFDQPEVETTGSNPGSGAGMASASSGSVSVTTTASTASSVTSSIQASPEREFVPATTPITEEVTTNGFQMPLDLEDDEEVETAEVEKVQETVTVDQDMFGQFTIAFQNRSKDLSERKLRQDFVKCVRIRGLQNSTGKACSDANGNGNGSDPAAPNVYVSYNAREDAEEAANDEALREKYPNVKSAANFAVRADKDGFYSVEFANSGMLGIREITEEFSKHGEVMKVITTSRGSKNGGVKRVTVSYGDEAAAVAAFKAYGSSKDFVAMDFSRECVEEMAA